MPCIVATMGLQSSRSEWTTRENARSGAGLASMPTPQTQLVSPFSVPFLARS